MPVCDNSKTAPACIAMSPTTGEALSTTFTFTAGLWDSSTASGWNDPDGPDSSVMYRFGYLVEGSDTPVMLSSAFGAAGANTITSDTLPAGLITPVVVARDVVNGDSEMVVAATSITVCVTTALCDASGNGTDVGAATEAMSSKLNEQLENLAATPEDVAANKNKLATVVQGVAATINDVTSSSTDPVATAKATAMRTTMANTLKDAVLATSGPPLDVGAAASALASISANPEQLSTDAQGVIVAVIDGILAQSSVITNGLNSEVAQNLVGAIGDTQKAGLASGRRALIGNKMMSQLKSITFAALLQTETGGTALTFSGTGLTMVVRKIPAQDLAGSQIGAWSLHESWGVQMGSETALTGDTTVILLQALRLSSTYVPFTGEAVSDLVSVSAWDTDMSAVSLAQGSILASFTLSATANSPLCTMWDGTKWQNQPEAMVSTTRVAGAPVTCNATVIGTFAVVDACDPGTTCSGHGSCRFLPPTRNPTAVRGLQQKCECDFGWSGPTCNTAYCDDIHVCHNGGRCICDVTPPDCLSVCLQTCSVDQCEPKCGIVTANYTAANCPRYRGRGQTHCECPCGFSGPYCDTPVVCNR